MHIVLQRVKSAGLWIQGREHAAIGPGLVLLVGFGREDGPKAPDSAPWAKLLDKIVSLRIFPDHKGRSQASLTDIRGSLLIVSQFTLYANWRKGRRPSFTPAAPPDRAQVLFHRFVADLTRLAPGVVACGEFGADMDVWLCNWGPFTLTLSSNEH